MARTKSTHEIVRKLERECREIDEFNKCSKLAYNLRGLLDGRVEAIYGSDRTQTSIKETRDSTCECGRGLQLH